MTDRAHHRRVRRPRLREHPQRPLTHLRRVLPVHRVPSLLEERNESQADSDRHCQPTCQVSEFGSVLDPITSHWITRTTSKICSCSHPSSQCTLCPQDRGQLLPFLGAGRAPERMRHVDASESNERGAERVFARSRPLLAPAAVAATGSRLSATWRRTSLPSASTHTEPSLRWKESMRPAKDISVGIKVRWSGIGGC